MRKHFLVLSLLAIAPLTAVAQTISTVAGGGPNNLPALSSNLAPVSVARDSAGNTYISDNADSRIYKVNAVGQLTVFAGTASPGFSGDGGPATSAALNAPAAIFLDKLGNLFIADAGNCLIRRVDASTGNISTVAGLVTGTSSGGSNSANCGGATSGVPATSTTLNHSFGVFVDGSGNIFIADSDNQVIREVLAATGIIQTVAGNGIIGFSGDGGPATSAQLSIPGGVFVDGPGNIFIADTDNCLIRRVDAATGKISTVAGTTTGAGNGMFSNCGNSGEGGAATNAKLGLPTDVVVDASGNFYIVEEENEIIREVTVATGKIQTVAGSGSTCALHTAPCGDGGPATSAMLNTPTGIFLDGGGDIFIADSNNFRVREVVASTGDIQTLAGNGTPGFSGDGGLATSASLNRPVKGVLDKLGNLFIADSNNYRVREVSAATGIIQTVAGTGVGNQGFNGDGIPATTANLIPNALSLDGSGNLFIADGPRIREVLASTGIIQTVAGSAIGCASSTSPCGDGGPATSAQLGIPTDVFVDASGNIFIADTQDYRIREVLAATGVIMTVAGNGNQCPLGAPCGDGGPATSATFAFPQGVVVDGSGNIFVADTDGCRIRRVDAATGRISTVAGNTANGPQFVCGFNGAGGAATSTELNTPSRVALDNFGDLFIADSGNDLVREVVAGTILTIAGDGIRGFTGDGGPATSADLDFPVGLAFDSSKGLFIADMLSNRIRLVTLAPRAPAVGFSPTSLTFGAQNVNTTSAAQSVTLRNTGNAPLTITSLVPSANFAETDNCIALSPVPPNGICTIHVTFTPTVSGNLMGTVTVTDNASNSPQSIGLSGTGVPPGAFITFSPTVLNFGGVSVGITSPAQMITVTNSGTQPLTISKVAASANYAETDNCVSSSPIPVNGTCTVSVTFTPAIGGPLPGTVAFTDNVFNSPQSVTLNGTGFGPAPVVLLSTFSLTFGPQGVGTMSAAKGVTLTNTGNATLNISSITFGGADPSDFSETDNCAPSVLQGANCTVNISFMPAAGGPRSAVLMVSDDAAGSPQKVSLNGLGIANIQTFAGNGTLGFGGDGGAATSAALFLPQGTAADRFGNVFIADRDNNRIREVLASTGKIQTVAGNGTRGFNGDGIAATTAELAFPDSVAVDASGNLYIADSFNNRIRKVDAATGLISTVAGNGTAGFMGDNGPATLAELKDPFGVAVDLSGNIFIADTSNQRVREVTASSGIIQTVAGTGAAGFSGDGGSAIAAQLQDPEGLAVDPSGNLFIADLLNNRIREVIASTGKILTVAGNGTAGFSGDGGSANNAGLNNPAGVALDGSGNIFIADTNNHRIREVLVTSGSTIYTVAGNGTAGFSGDGGIATSAQLQFPMGVNLDASGNLYVTDTDNSRVRRIGGSGTVIPSAANLSTPGLSYGNQRVGTTSAAQMVTVTNSAAGVLTVSSVAASPNFTETDNCVSSSPIPSGGNCTINVTFAPAVGGNLMGMVTITDNAPGSPQTVSLSGTGILPISAVSPSFVPFGNQRMGTTSASADVTLSNTGTDTLHVSSIALTGTDSAQFALGPPSTGTACSMAAAFTLLAGSSCAFSVKFAPTSLGGKSAAVTITDDSNATAGAMQSATLLGTGVFPQAMPSPSPAGFGNQPTNQPSAPMTVTLTNGGTDTLHLAAAGAVAITGANASDFAIVAGTSTCTNGAMVAANGGTCVINITFDPPVTGVRSAMLTITDDANPTAQVVMLTGTGVTAMVNLNPSPLAFGNERTGVASGAMNITLTNSGGLAVQLAAMNAVAIGGANAGDFALAAGTTCTNGLVIAAAPGPGNTCVISITFTPGATGPRTATVTVTDNANPTTQSANLMGTGVFPQATPSPTSVPFGNQRKGTTSASMTVTLTNGGTDTLHLDPATAVVLSGANAGDFAIAAGTTCANGGAVVPNGGTCVVKLTFTPSTTAAEAATLAFTDDANPTTQPVSLTGTGVLPTAGVAPGAIPFGNQRTGTTSAGTDVTLSNTGTDTLHITSLALTGTDTTQFTLGAPSAGTACTLAGAFTVAPGTNCKFSVKFAPTSLGAKSASATITDDTNGLVGSMQAVTLTGTGVFPQAAPSPSPAGFGNQPTNQPSAPMTVTLTNGGTDTLHLAAAGAVAITGANASDFAIVAGTSTCTNGAMVAANGGTCVINITFDPPVTGVRSAMLTITDDANPTAQVVMLTGTGVTAVVNLNPSPLAFGNQRTGVASGAMNITLTNSGGLAVQLAAMNAVAIGGANAGDFALAAGTTCTNGLVVAAAPGPGNTCVISVTFTPGATGARTATVTVTDNANPTTQTANLTGTGVFPQATPSPTTVTFTNQVITTTSAAMRITLTNGGTDTLHLDPATAVALSGANAADFALSAGTTCVNSAMVAPNGGFCIINVSFTPSAVNARTAMVAITDDASPTIQNVMLNGTGTNPVPGITSLSPASATAGGAGFMLTVNGASFVNGAVVTFNGIAETTVFVSAMQLTATINAADFATGGLANVTVTNPAPGGGASPASTFTINNPAPGTPSLSPSSATAGGAAFVLTVNGSSFVSTSTVTFNGKVETAQFVNATQLTASIPAADITKAGMYNVTVTNPTPGGGTSPAATFTVNNPVPAITTVSPANATAGSAAFTLTVNGSSFASTSVVNFNGAAKTTTFVSATQLTASIAAADIATGAVVNVTVTNPAPGGGTAAAATFTINNPSPSITTLSPASTLAAGVAFTLTVNGTNFVSTSVVNFNGSARTTMFVSATQLTAMIAAADISAAGVANITVTNPAPGGGASSNSPLTVNNAAPTLSSLSPNNTLAGSVAFTLTINGSGFINGAIASFNGAPKATAFVNSTQLTASITAADVATGGLFNVTVINPAPTVGPSAAQTFTVNNPAPTVTGISPASMPAGTGFTLAVNGTNFVSTSVVFFNGHNEPTTFISATQLTAAIPATDVTTGGMPAVSVTNPVPGGGASTSLTETLNDFTPSAPNGTATVAAGMTATFTITITPSANGFANPVTFNISGLPPATMASFSPAMLTPGMQAGSTTLSIITAKRGALPVSPGSRGVPPALPLGAFYVAVALLGALALATVRRKEAARRLAACLPLALVLAGLAVVSTGCGPGMHGTPAGTSTLSVTATSGSDSKTVTVTLNVQ